MAEQPFEFNPKSLKDAVTQMQRLMDDLYQERLAGAQAGDVFQVDNNTDILTLTLAAAGGITKIANALSIMIDSAGPMTLSSNGLNISPVSTTKNGAAPKLPNDATKYLNGTGTYTVPGGGSGGYQPLSEKNAANGYAGLNSSSRTTKGVDTTDDIIIDLATKGLVLKDTQGTPHYWRVDVTIAGSLSTSDLGTVKP